MAGPVYAAAVILPPGLEIEGVNDSKKLTEKKREALFPEIKEKALAYCVASASEREIDEINILNATYLAMARAVEGLPVKADYALIDGNRMPRLPVPGETIVKGDGLSMSIACASILAKVTRDHVMMELDQKYPQYQFAKHKGYGTKLHTDLIRQYGPCEIHRQSFFKKDIRRRQFTGYAGPVGWKTGRGGGSRLFGEKRLSHFREELSLLTGKRT